MFEAYQTEIIQRICAPQKDKWGSPVLGGAAAPVDVRARVKWKSRYIRNITGNRTLSTGSIVINDKPDFTDTFRITGRMYTVVAIVEADDYQPDHYEVFLK